MAFDLKQAYGGCHKTIVHLPIGTEDGEGRSEPIEIWFRPATPDMLNQLAADHGGDNLSVVEAQALALSKYLVRWSVTSDGAPVEPTREVLGTLNRVQLDALLEAINSYTFPKKTS